MLHADFELTFFLSVSCMCMDVMPSCMSMHHVHVCAWYPHSPGNGVQFLELELQAVVSTRNRPRVLSKSSPCS